jgi:hypothetical protein
MQRLLFVWSFVLCACSGSTPAPGPDAAGPAPRAFGAACGSASTNAPDCDSHVCTDTIDTAGHPVCSQTCTMLNAQDPSCPNGSMGHKCNMKGYCRP